MGELGGDVAEWVMGNGECMRKWVMGEWIIGKEMGE